MRIRWYDRVLFALSGLLLFALGALLVMTGLREPKAVSDLGVKLIQVPFGFAAAQSIRAGEWYALTALIGSGLILALWGVRQWISLIPKQRREAFFTATEAERGTLTIARPALEHLVHKCVAEHPEITVSKINIVSENDKALIRLRATMRSGVSMPKVSSALQKEIISYMAECAGISVSSVRVIVEDTTPPLLPDDSRPSRRPALPQPELKREQHTEPDAIPIPLGAVVDDEPAIPASASTPFGGEWDKDEPIQAREADEITPGQNEGEPVIDRMFSMDDRIEVHPVNGEEDEEDGNGEDSPPEGGVDNAGGS
ncbi:MAG: alkaline shock response membrane anchor protein AmaP [Oscillospiraceae bacterium]|jgi:uncharacterized alkaline shock family protein YloU|nr:alkaline shock response membrane anchor protein AmaP [Oscillospiraceae bacterium]